MNLSTEAALKAYKKSQVDLDILSADPGTLVLKVYDYIISACKKGKARDASRGLVLLIDALDSEQAISANLFELYRYAMDRVKAGEFEEASTIIRGLREAWAAALSSEKSR